MDTEAQKKLVLELKNGNEDAFEKFVLTFGDKIRSMAYNITQDQEAVKDIAQNVYINVFRKIAFFRNESKLSSWVYRIAMNEIFMHFRKEKKCIYGEFCESFWIAPKSSCPEYALLYGEFKNILGKSIKSLGDKEKSVFICRDIEEMPTNEVCKTLNATVPAVKSRLLRGRRKLRKSFIGRYLSA